jgi:hypothetical protein
MKNSAHLYRASRPWWSHPTRAASLILIAFALTMMNAASNATTTVYGGLCVAVVSPHTRSALFVNDLLLGTPLLFFLAVRAAHARSDVRRLSAARSRMLWGYYVGAWVAGLLCLARLNLLDASAKVSLRASDVTPPPARALDAAWVAVRAGLTGAEVSAVAFLAAGHLAPTGAALLKTGVAAGLVAGLEASAEAALVFRDGVPLFRWGGGRTALNVTVTAPTRGDLARLKWAWWTVRGGVATAAYSALAALPTTRARSLLPARPAFYRYATQMAALHGLATAGAALLWAGARRVGYCSSAVASLGLGAAWPMLFSWAFLGEFFSDTGLDVDAAYYAEMRDAGYFAEEAGGGGGGRGEEEDPWF